MTTIKPVSSPLNPGSTLAKARGCSCSPVLNFFGRGHGGAGSARLFEVESTCPVHGETSPADGSVRDGARR